MSSDIDPAVGLEQQMQQRHARFKASAVLRAAGGAAQTVVGILAHAPAMTVEGVEELNDAGVFASSALELSRTGKARQTIRNVALGFAGAASTFATIEVGYEWATEADESFYRVEALDLMNNTEHKVALLAVALSTGVFWLNRNGHKSSFASDRFAFRDSLKDFVIPGGLLVIFGVRAPHIAEFGLETWGVAYGWNNTRNLWKDWRKKPTIMTVSNDQ